MPADNDDTYLDRPNRRKASSKATKAIVAFLLIVSAVIVLIITVGGWDTLEGAKPVQIGYIIVYAVLAFYIARWNRGALPLTAALAILLGIFAAIAAVLGATGIYGVLAYMVGQRKHEIGIRMALGAERGAVLGLILRRGAVRLTVGIALGLAGAAGLNRYLSGMLFELTPLDPATYAAVAVLFAAVALAASYLPARRATQVDPVVALRCD
jgi:ABC-type antimicrobial peptide transport system permease subunit